MVDVFLHERTKLYLRPDVDGVIGDAHVINEQNAYHTLPITENSVVLDVGAHVGAFTRLVALPRGARQVVAVEPDPDSFQLLVKNTSDFSQVVRYSAAAVSDDRSEVELFLGNRMSTMNTLVPTRGRKSIKVPAVKFSELLTQYQPSVIKMDIEGGEYSLIDDLEALPEHVRAIAIEVHPYKGDRTRQLSDYLVASLERQFPNVLRKPRLTSKSWIAQGVYSRD